MAAGPSRTAGVAEDDLRTLLDAAPPGGGDWLVIVDGLDEIVDGAERRDTVRRLAGPGRGAELDKTPPSGV